MLYPLLFEPLYQYRVWGGRHLGQWLRAPLPDGPVGEAWLLSDRNDHSSRIANGPLKGQTISDLMADQRGEILGGLADRFERFPLLLKFLDVEEMLSVQVHPPDERRDLIPEGDTGKTEAWFVLDTKAKSRIYAGLKPGTTAQDLRALSRKTVNDHLASFTPKRDQAVLINAGVVHSIGDGLVVFEVQQNSDVTFRLYDWDRVDPKTGHKRPLQVEEALACVDFDQGAIEPVASGVSSEPLVSCTHFDLVRRISDQASSAGRARSPTVLVCTDGKGTIGDSIFEKGDVMLLPASIGECLLRPLTRTTLLEITIPDPL